MQIQIWGWTINKEESPGLVNKLKDYFLPLLPRWLRRLSFTTPGKQPGTLFGYSLSLNASVSRGPWGLGLLDGESLTLAAGNTHREENLLSWQYQTPFRQEACPHPFP